MACKNYKLNQRMTIQSLEKTDDGQGGKSEQWINSFNVFGQIEPMSANQVLFSQQNQHRITHKIFIRYRKGLSIEQRILFKDRIFQIKGIKNQMEADRWLEISAEEGSAS